MITYNKENDILVVGDTMMSGELIKKIANLEINKRYIITKTEINGIPIIAVVPWERAKR